MDQETLESYKKAGNIAAQALAYGKELLKPEASVLDICSKVEKKIQELGGNMAFPVQLSLNETAAHSCPEDDDKTTLKDQLVSLDVGVHINGFIGDNACTVDLSGNNSEIVKASEEALNNAIKIIKTGTKLNEIGKVIQETIESHGFKPIRNLSGHGLDTYNVHSTPTVPNFDDGNTTALEQDQIIAIEPFATTGAGMIHEKGTPSVYMLKGKKPVRIGFVRNIVKQLESYNGLPFTTRWLTKNFSQGQVRFALNQLKQLEILKEFPPLVEKQNGLVSQSEHTIIVGEPSIILTKAQSSS